MFTDAEKEAKRILKYRRVIFIIGLICAFSLTVSFDYFSFFSSTAPEQLGENLANFYKNIYIQIFIILPFNVLALYFLAGVIVFLKAHIELDKIEGYFLHKTSIFWAGYYANLPGGAIRIHAYSLIGLDGEYGIAPKELLSHIPQNDVCACQIAKFPKFPGINNKFVIDILPLTAPKQKIEEKIIKNTHAERSKNLDTLQKTLKDKIVIIKGKAKKIFNDWGDPIIELNGEKYHPLSKRLSLMMPQYIEAKFFIRKDKKKIIGFVAAAENKNP
ncbi:hypothetical protein HZA39_00115 [Candidatus Peregrinibacteria bacterium]|nr:hypothetical protein [Candidatus Peregrinibacteria bacterium]